MKKLVVSLIVLSIFTIGCEAFKDSYDNVPGGEEVVTNPPAPPSGDQNKVVCEAMKGITVIKSKDAGVIKDTVLSALDSKVVPEAVATKISDDIVKVVISADGKEEVAIAIKRMSDEEFVACSFAYEKISVAGGEITIDSFNEGAKVVNAAAFKFEMAGSVEKTSLDVIKDLVAEGTKTSVEGSYYTEGYAVETK